MITVKKSKKFGRGVFASIDLKPNVLVEKSPLILIPKEDIIKIEASVLDNYVYEFKDGLAVALGMGSLFNHSDKPNVQWKILRKEQCVIFWTDQDIKAGDQLFIDYGYNPLDK